MIVRAWVGILSMNCRRQVKKQYRQEWKSCQVSHVVQCYGSLGYHQAFMKVRVQLSQATQEYDSSREGQLDI